MVTNYKSTVTLAMLFVGAMVLIAETTWLLDAKSFVTGKVSK